MNSNGNYDKPSQSTHIATDEGVKQNSRAMCYLTGYFKNKLECVIIIAAALILFFCLSVLPMFDIQYQGEAATLFDAFEISRGSTYVLLKPFVDFLIVLFIFDMVAVVSGILKWKKISLVAALLAVLYMGQIIVEASGSSGTIVDGLVNFSFGFWVVLGLNIVIIVASLKE